MIEFSHTDEMIFKIGEADVPTVECGEYVINVSQKGLCVSGKDTKGLFDGFMTLIDMIEMNDEGEVRIPCVTLEEAPFIKNRMIHFCVFPDTDLWELDKFISMCGALKYTHIVLEFWGMIKYDCMKELSWGHAFSKEQIRPLIKKANELGIEIVPMFNHWGHAPQCRNMHGKHVTLDQNPAYQYLFSPSGWNWNVKNPRTRDLFKKIRGELIELCGEGDYFHMGCDEAFEFEFTEENMEAVCSFMNEVAEDLKTLGRQTIMWGDMLLYRQDSYSKDNHYYASCPTEECQNFMLQRIDENIIMADWQYEAKHAPVETALTLQERGYRTMLAPYDMGLLPVQASVKTARDAGLFGIMHTTWNTLSSGTPYVGIAAVQCWDDELVIDGVNYPEFWAKVAAVQRKAYNVRGDYEKSGWAKCEISVKT